MFTARNRQNPFAKRRRAQAEAAKGATAAPASSPEPPAPKPVQMAAPFDRNPESEEYVQAPDISTFATGGIVEAPKPTLVEPSTDEQHDQIDPAPVMIDIPAATQAKIDAVMNRTLPAGAEYAPQTFADLVETAERGEKHDFNTAALEDDTATDEAPASKRGRGRPRPQETIDRDNAVYALLIGADPETGISKESIAAELDEKEQQVYSSLRQLSKEGRAATRYVKPHGYRWFAVQGD